MKKMVCEICGSQSIRKENGVFVCQECGTEYSVEDAKGLLTEIDSSTEVETKAEAKEESSKILSENDKNELLKKLCLWAELLKSFSAFEELDFKTNDSLIWSLDESTLDRVKDRLPLIISEYDVTLKNVHRVSSNNHPFTDKVYEYYLDLMKLKESDVPADVKQEYNFWLERSSKYSSLGLAFMIGVATYSYSDYEAHSLVRSICEDHCSLLEWCYKLAEAVDGDKKLLIWKEAIFVREDHDLGKLGLKIKSIINEKLKIYEKDKKEVLLPAIQKRKLDLLKLVEASKELEEIFNLPIEYRTVDAVFFMIKAIYDGKVETWKEAVLLLDETNFRNAMLYSLSEISNQLSLIDKKITAGFVTISNQLSVMNARLNQLNTLIEESNACLMAIGVFSAITAFGSY